VRIAEMTPGLFEEAEAAFAAGEHERAVRLGQVIVFWEPENEEAAVLVQRAGSQIELAQRGRQLTERESESEYVLEGLTERLNAIGEAEADPAATEAQLMALESEMRSVSGQFAGTPLEEKFTALLESTSARTVAAHELRLLKEARGALERERETQRMRAEAMGIRDFLAPVATLNNGGKTVDIETLMVPGGIMIFDFYADWHAPCRELDPQLRMLAQSQDKVYLRRINMLNWDTPLARQYALKSIPSVWIYDGEGEMVASGLSGFDAIRAAVRKAGAP
jgi:thiol-disulfide isomerase/thioredoxin